MKFDLEALKFITCTLDAWQSPKLLFQCKPQKTVLTGNQPPYAHFLQPDHHALKCRHLLTYISAIFMLWAHRHQLSSPSQ